MEALDCYQVLQVDPKAEPEVIQAAYRRLAAKYHPDVNKTAPEDAERRMKEINAAYAVLGDLEARAEYDESYVRSGGRRQREYRSGPRTRPRFEVRPQSVEIRGVDPNYPTVYPQIQLSQIAGDPYDPALDQIEFVLKAPFNRALLLDVDFLSASLPFLIRLTLDLAFMGIQPGHSHVGTINVRGDPSAGFVLVVDFREPTTPSSHAHYAEGVSAAQGGEARGAGVIRRFSRWLVQPVAVSAEARPTLAGLAARIVIVLSLALAVWVIATNLIPIFVGLVVLLGLLLLLVALVASVMQPPPKRRRAPPRRRR